MLKDLILGTAGHIDHGKTSLIGALTGTNTDRLPEEKKRGITIELGYAHLDIDPFRLGIVDVPGHEKFVRQMLAGATGMDLALLVVAADDSVKQQTREHLDILRILDLPAGVIALTKSDLVDPDWLEMVEDEVRELVQGTFLADAPIVRTSAKTGAGLDDLKSALKTAAETAAASSRQLRLGAPFKMAIDRTFTVEGHGTVVTGSVSSGTVNVGDHLELQPGNHKVRVRSLQNHDESSDEVHRGQRAALNLAGVNLQAVERGHEVCAVDHLKPAKLMTLKLFLLNSILKPFKDRTRIRFHVGTAEMLGVIRILDGTELAPGQSGFAQVYLTEPAVAIWNQPFVIRRESPVYTIGGGRILEPNAARIRRASETDLKMLNELSDAPPVERAAASAYLQSGSDSWVPSSLPRTAGVFDVDDTFAKLKDNGTIRSVKVTATRSILLHKQRFSEFCERVLKTLERLHTDNPLRFKHPLNELNVQFNYLESMELLAAAINELKELKKINVNRESIGLVGAGPKMSKGERLLLEQLTGDLKSAGIKPPTPKELQQSAKKNRDSVPQLLRLAADNGDLVQVSDELFYHRETMDSIKETLSTEIQKNNGLTMSEIRQLLDTTRKYAIPLCEYLDSINFTCRDGDKRMLA